MLVTSTTHDLDSGVCEVAVAGALDIGGVPVLRVAVRKALAEQPMAVILDLNGLVAVDRLSLLILPTLERRAASDYGLHLRCRIDDSHRWVDLVREAVGRYVAVYASREEALEAGLADSAGCHRSHARLPADVEASATAREFTASACERWRIGQVSEEAQVIVSELANNAVLHAGADFDLVLVYRPPFLHIQVVDADPRVPLFPISTGRLPRRPPPAKIGGWGLYLVYAVAWSCGVVVRPGGKIVWATVRTRADV